MNLFYTEEKANKQKKIIFFHLRTNKFYVISKTDTKI